MRVNSKSLVWAGGLVLGLAGYWFSSSRSNFAGDGAGTASSWSDLPTPPRANLPKPSGTRGNLNVLNWAGFKGAVSFTFDDALPSQLDHYPTFKATGVRMTFYLVCRAGASRAGWKQLAMDGQELGNHTQHHCYANGSGCAWGTFTNPGQELDACTSQLKSAFGVLDVYTMASPMGDPGWDTHGSTRFLVNRGITDHPDGIAPNDATNPYELPSHVAAEAEKAEGGFNPVVDSTAAKGIWRIISIHSVGNNDGYHPVDAKEVAASMTYAKGLGTVWVDSVVNIAAYWRAQKLISTTSPTTAGNDKTWTWTLPAHFPPGRYLRVKVDGGRLEQGGSAVPRDSLGYYEVALDAGSLTLSL